MDATLQAIGNEPVAVEELTSHISTWLRQQFDQSGVNRFVLGISGGIDSAVVAGLCARAVGPDKMVGVIMPSASNPDDERCANLVADAFGFRTARVDLTGVADSLYAVMPDSAALTIDEQADIVARRQQLATANVRPRLRMTTIYYIANIVGGMVVGTGNKSEAMIGYTTKYGDAGVDILPIVDLYKYEVRAVARHIGVPRDVIERPPSAGLWQGQTDEAEIGMTYELLDQTLLAIERGQEANLDPAVVARVKSLIAASAHKRNPLPAFIREEQGL